MVLLGRGRAARRRGLPRARGCHLLVTLGLSYQLARVWHAKLGTAADEARARRLPFALDSH